MSEQTVYERLDSEVQEICDKFLDTHTADNLNELARQIRKVANDASGAGEIKGYVLALNDVDCSGHVSIWPESAFTPGRIKVKFTVLGSEPESPQCTIHSFEVLAKGFEKEPESLGK